CASGGRIWVALVTTPSQHLDGGRLATDMSLDGRDWFPLPTAIAVRASKYALVRRSLRRADEEVDLSSYAVAVGAKAGTPIGEFLRGRVDKACGLAKEAGLPQRLTRVAYVAEIVAPYAV